MGFAALGLLLGLPASPVQARGGLDREALREVRSVAVIGFNVPSDVHEATPQGDAVSALSRAFAAWDEDEEAVEGNGGEVADAAVAGFVETLAAAGLFRVRSLHEVTEIPVVRRWVTEGSSARPKAAPAGLPFLTGGNLGRAAREVCAALPVDVVIAVDFVSLAYELNAGIGLTGGVKAYGRADVVFLDGSGRVLWRLDLMVRGAGSSPMVAGVVVPSDEEGWHRGIGVGLAKKVIQRWRKKVLR